MSGVCGVRRRELMIALAGAVVAPGQEPAPDKEESWRQYLEWSAGRRGKNLPGQDYRDQLISEGVSIYEVDRRVQQLNNRLLATPGAWRDYFNRQYGTARARTRLNQVVGFEPGPNTLLQTVVGNLKPGKALDVAMGQGRNAIYLAQQGWDVSGFDVSDVGLALANANAKRVGVVLKTAVASYSSYGYGTEQWDLIVMAYPFTPLSERFARKIVKSLRPGGVLVYEHLMATDDNSRLVELGAAGMPFPGRLAELYSDLEIEQDEIVRKVPDWGPLEEVLVVRLVARKP